MYRPTKKSIDGGEPMFDPEKTFTYHAPKPGQTERYTELREKAKEFALLIAECCPEGREKSFAYTKLQESVMWANASIALNE